MDYCLLARSNPTVGKCCIAPGAHPIPETPGVPGEAAFRTVQIPTNNNITNIPSKATLREISGWSPGRSPEYVSTVSALEPDLRATTCAVLGDHSAVFFTLSPFICC